MKHHKEWLSLERNFKIIKITMQNSRPKSLGYKLLFGRLSCIRSWEPQVSMAVDFCVIQSRLFISFFFFLFFTPQRISLAVCA